MSPARARVPAPVALALALALAGPAAGQDVSLERVDSLARMGMTEEARVLLERWQAAEGRAVSRQDTQRSLWLRAVLTVDPSQAVLDFQRLVVEFPAGPWTDEALLRLARYAEARGDLPEAAAHYRALARDHPGSPAALTARGWLEANSDAVREAERRAAAAGPSEPDAPAALPPDTLGRERVARARPPEGPERKDEPARGAEGRPEPAEPKPQPQEPAGGADAAEGGFTVQLGAFSSEPRARVLIDRVRSAGFTPRLVRVSGSDLLRVRVGRFPDAATAAGTLDRLVARGFEAIVSTDAARETPAGGGSPPGDAR